MARLVSPLLVVTCLNCACGHRHARPAQWRVCRVVPRLLSDINNLNKWNMILCLMCADGHIYIHRRQIKDVEVSLAAATTSPEVHSARPLRLEWRETRSGYVGPAEAL